MAHKRFDDDYDDDDYCGIVGGELTSSNCAGCDGQDYDFGPCRSDAELLDGEEYAYLGHFRKPEFAREGHNMVLQEPGLPPLEIPNSGVNMSSNMGGLRQGPIGGAINKALSGFLAGLL